MQFYVLGRTVFVRYVYAVGVASEQLLRYVCITRCQCHPSPADPLTRAHTRYTVLYSCTGPTQDMYMYMLRVLFCYGT